MTTTDYLIDSTLVLLVLLQIKERPLTVRQLLRPVIILGVAVASYLHGIPTAGNDLVLAGAFVLLGGAIGVASGQTVFVRRGEAGEALVRSGWLSGFFWVLGMGSRMAFLVWIAHGGARRSRTSARTTRSRAPRRGRSHCSEWQPPRCSDAPRCSRLRSRPNTMRRVLVEA